MRVTRSLLLLLAVALLAAGCARQPVAQVPVAVAPGLVAPSIDSTVYGPIVAAPARVAVATPAPVAGRGLVFAASGPAAPVVFAKPLAYAPTAREGPYTLDSGDRLRIVVFGQDGLSNSYVVDASGYIAMPLIGTVLARGATTEQLSSRVADKLRQGFVRDPHVAVEIEAYRPFFILGEVTQPGQYPYVADMTVETAVAIAGGFGPRAFRKTVTLTRMINGQQVRFTVPTSYTIRPGDTINVQERWF
jgi:polysaccharide export outer membrane protein